MGSFSITRKNGDVYEVLVDDADLDRVVVAGPWHVKITPWATYVTRDVPAGTGQSAQQLHRFLTEAPKGVQVDHVNRDGLDNRRENLRLCTQTQNLANRGRFSNNTSGFKGVSWYAKTRKWKAQIQVGKVKRHLGYFDLPEDAHKAYCKAAEEGFGKFARGS